MYESSGGVLLEALEKNMNVPEEYNEGFRGVQ